MTSIPAHRIRWGPIALLITVFATVGMPLFLALILSFSEFSLGRGYSGFPTWSSYRAALQPDIWHVVTDSFIRAVLSTIVVVITLVPWMTVARIRRDFSLLSVVEILLLLPLFTPAALRIHELRSFLANVHTLPDWLLFSDSSICLGLIHSFAPFMLLPYSLALRSISETQLHSLRDAGGSSSALVWFVATRFARGGLLVGSLVMLTAGWFGSLETEILGSSFSLRTSLQGMMGADGYARAFAASMLPLLPIAIAAAIGIRGEWFAQIVPRRRTRASEAAAGVAWAPRILLLPLVTLAVLPAAAVLVRGFSNLPELLGTFDDARLRSALSRSLLSSVLVAATVVPLCLAAFARFAVLGRRSQVWLLTAAFLPLLVPETTHALALGHLLTLLGGRAGEVPVILACVAYTLPFISFVTVLQMSLIPERSWMTAVDAGASGFRAFMTACWPTARFSAVLSCVFAVLLSLGEFTRTEYLSSREYLSEFIVGQLGSSSGERTYGAVAILQIIGTILIITAFWFRQRESESTNDETSWLEEHPLGNGAGPAQRSR